MTVRLQQVWADARYCLRSLGRNLDTTLAALVSLGLGIGLSSTLFTFVHAALFAPLPVHEPEDLVAIYTKLEDQSRLLPVSLPNAEDIAALATAFSGVTAYQSLQIRIGTSSNTEPVWGQLVSGNFFELLGVKPELGRTFLPAEGRVPGRDPVVVLSHDLWKSRFAANPGILGKTISLNRHVLTVVGVAAKGFRGPSKLFSCALWVPLSMAGQLYPSPKVVHERGWQIFRLIARLRPGMTKAAGQQELASIGQRLEQEYPGPNKKQTFVLVPFGESLLGMNQRALYVRAATLLSLLSLLILFLVCANVANLFLSRVLERDREIALRLAVGAGRGDVAQLLLIESLILALFAGILAVMVTGWAAPILWSFRPPEVPKDGLNLSLKPAVLAFTLGVSLVVSLFVWSVPLWQLRRRDLSSWLRDLPGRQGPTLLRSRLRSLLLVAQAAFAFVALAASTLLLRDFWQIGRMDPGFETQHLLVLSCDLDVGSSEDHRRRTYERLVEEVRRLPGVRAAALSENLLFRPARLVRRVFADGTDRPALRDGLAMPTSSVSPGYFQTLGLPLLMGRGFGPEQRQGGPPVAIVNQTFARMAWDEEYPLGRTLRLDDEPTPVTLIGIVRDSRYESLTEGPTPHVFLSLDQYYSPSAALYVRTEQSEAEIRNLVAPLARVLPEVSVTSIRTARGLIEDSLWASRAGACLLGSFAATSLVLALLGIYCLTRRTVQQRRHEIGVRVALGADHHRVFWMIVGQALGITALGILVGAVATVGFGRVLASSLYDPALLGAGPLLATGAALLTAAFVGGALPARRAMRLNPKEIFEMDG